MNAGTPPKSFITEGRWPTGTLASTAPPVARRLAHAAAVLATWINAHRIDVVDVAADAGVPASEVADLLAGTGECSLETLAALEAHIDEELWQ